MNEIEDQTRANADHAHKASGIAQDASQAARNGQGYMTEMMDAMKLISSTGEETQRIAASINKIADETNLLALNASVEAARAGHHGRGFAVVAEEIGKLAKMSAKAAQETSDLIRHSNEQINDGVKVCESAAEALREIDDNVARTSELVCEIAEASETQVRGIAEVNNGLLEIDSATQLTASAAEESAVAAEEMSSQAHTLSDIVSKFNLKQPTLN